MITLLTVANNISPHSVACILSLTVAEGFKVAANVEEATEHRI